jgi:2-aminoadipate transaminase
MDCLATINGWPSISSDLWYAGAVRATEIQLDPAGESPIYRQLYEQIAGLISTGDLQLGERLPATRKLAGQLGLNRTTVSAAYELLENQGLISGQVGRGSFVASRTIVHTRSEPVDVRPQSIAWDEVLPAAEGSASPSPFPVEISFSSSRPMREGFPLDAFRKIAREVIDGPKAADILELGSPLGYPPLRSYLLEEARASGLAQSGDDLLITNGCQQALDLLARVLARKGGPIAVEDPVYHGLWQVFARAGAELVPVPVTDGGIDLDALELLLERQRPRVLLVTPNFQNPTGATIPAPNRKRLMELARRYGTLILESDIYSELRYTGQPLTRLKQMDEQCQVALLGSYSKISFPGLRVGWVLGPRPLIASLTECKQMSDLHSDQLAQAVLLRFAESGELKKHLEQTRALGARRLGAVLRACRDHLPAGTRFSRPQGGMSLWLELPSTLRAHEILVRAREQGVDFLPGSYFSPGRPHARALRLSFGGLTPEQIERGVRILGKVIEQELSVAMRSAEPMVALV